MNTLSPPSKLSLARESLFWVDILSLPSAFLTEKAKNITDRPPVTVIPGLGASDRSMRPLRAYLRRKGYAPEGWGLGLNLGGMGKLTDLNQLSDRWNVDRDHPHVGEGEVPHMCDLMTERVKARADNLGRPISLVGWSLGGYIAREVARDLPQEVNRVITLGSPAFGGPKYTSAAALYRKRDFDLDWLESEVLKRFDTPITQPVTNIYSKRDGVVGWTAARDELSPDVTHIEVNCAHIALGLNKTVWGHVVEALSTK